MDDLEYEPVFGYSAGELKAAIKEKKKEIEENGREITEVQFVSPVPDIYSENFLWSVLITHGKRSEHSS